MKLRLLLAFSAVTVASGILLALHASAAAIPAIPMPTEGLDRNGLVRAWSASAGLRSVDNLQSISLFDGRIYAHTSGGLLQVFDAETGRQVWNAQIGQPDRVSFPPAVNAKLVFVLNGGTLYAANRETGRPEWQVRLSGAPSASPAANDDYVYVPFTSGRVTAYKIGGEHPAFYLQTLGSVLVPPVANRETLAVASRDGALYIAHPDTARIYFRFETSAPLMAPMTRYGRTFLLASADYNVYALNLGGVGTSIAAPPPGPPGSTSAMELGLLGTVLWRFPSGDPIVEPPVAVGEYAYVAPQRGGLFQLEFQTGSVRWHEPSAAKFVAASKKSVYALDHSGNLLVLDLATGAPRGAVDAQRLRLAVTNDQTDRIYLSSPDGFLVCLREAELTLPLTHRVTVEPPLPPRPVQPKSVDAVLKTDTKPKPKPAPKAVAEENAKPAPRKTATAKSTTKAVKTTTPRQPKAAAAKKGTSAREQIRIRRGDVEEEQDTVK